jgi:hypothetical protein
VARFEVKNPVQQWYGDMSFNGFGFGYDAVVINRHKQAANRSNKLLKGHRSRDAKV